MRKPLTGEPDAGKPPVRFGGRGRSGNGRLLPQIIQEGAESWRFVDSHAQAVV